MGRDEQQTGGGRRLEEGEWRRRKEKRGLEDGEWMMRKIEEE